jgi:NADP-dependent 3-hydroxy acid dehydrogenase YdfG
MSSLAGKVAIVTGASAGIGVAVARSLADAGANVVLAARRADRIEALARELPTDALAVACDVADDAQVDALVGAALDRFGQVDVLVNNAGLGSFARVVDTDPAEWRRMLDVNVTGTFLCSRAVLPGMLERGDGCIVNVCSDVSRRTFPGGAAYCASKWAQYAFGQALGAEVREHGIRVGAVLPGMVSTEFNGGKPEDRLDWVLRPEDVAEAVTFLATRPPHAVVDELVVHPVQQVY